MLERGVVLMVKVCQGQSPAGPLFLQATFKCSTIFMNAKHLKVNIPGAPDRISNLSDDETPPRTVCCIFYKKLRDHFNLFIQCLALVPVQEQGKIEDVENTNSKGVETMRISVVFPVMFTMVLNMVPGMLAAEHKVGGSLGWNYPPTRGAGFFANWAAQNQYRVGDTLSFEYIAGTHNVVQVDRADYEACTSNRPVKLYSANKVVVNLPNPGTYYYICGIKGHCEYGMKVAFTVT